MKINVLHLINMKNQNYTSKPPSILEIKYDKEFGYIATETRLATHFDIENANLISACPDMFQALQAIVDAFGDQDSLLIDQCKAALAKAKWVEK